MTADIRRALALLDRADRWRWAGLVPLALVVAALEAAGAASVFALVRTLTFSVDAQQSPALHTPGRLGAIAVLSPAAAIAAVILFYLARNAALLIVETTQERVVQRTASRIATRLLVRYLHAPYAFHFQRSSSSLMHAVRDGVDIVVEHVLSASVHIASELLVVAGLLVLLAFAAPTETLAAVLVVLVLLIAPVGATRRLYARWGEEEWQIGQRMIERLQQASDTLKQILVSGRQDYFAARYAAERGALEHAKRRRTFATTAIRLGVETVFICAMLLALAMLTRGGRSGAEAVSVLSLFAYAGFRIVPSANRIIQQVNALRFGRPFVESLVSDWRHLDDGSTRAPAPAAGALPFTRAIALEHVSYEYGDARGRALTDVSVTIPRGGSVGVVGATGAGKSTFVDVVMGLLEPTSGRVLVDGRDIREATRAWQAQIGYVPQDVMVIDDTVRRNVAFGVGAIDEARVAAVVAAARLDGLVASLRDGLETTLGERGIRLSGGERQRIAIARALYADPAVLVFDEATSALDRQTEQEIVDAIDAVRGSRTVIVIAHRLTTVQHCDRILVLEGGRLVSEGTYDELLAESAVFRALALAKTESP